MEIFPAADVCPCGSGVEAKDCCIAVEPPVACRNEGYNRFDLNLELFDQLGRRVRVPEKMEFEVSANVPHQFDRQLEHVNDVLMHSADPPPDGEAMEWIKRFGGLVANTVDALYAVRYHQQQFFSRLRIVASKQAFGFEPPKGNMTVRINDQPLRFELEAFLVRLKTSLDATSRLTSFLMHQNPRTYGALWKLVESNRELPGGSRDSVRSVLQENKSWVDEAARLRNAIVHESSFGAFRGVGNQGPLLLDAEIAGKDAGEFCIFAWKRLLQMTPQLATAAVVDD